MSSTRTAVVLGASGSVGDALVKELIRSGSFSPVVTLVRRSQPDHVAAARPAVVSIFRPAMIIGSRHTPWLLEKVLPAFAFLTPAKYKSITIQQIAKAMIAASLKTPARSAVYHYPEMVALNG